VIPIVDSAWLHLWMGNNPAANGVVPDADVMKSTLGEERYHNLTGMSSQPQRYQTLAQDVVDYVADNPAQAVKQRIWSGLYFVMGEAWFSSPLPGQNLSASGHVPDWLTANYQVIVNSVLLGILLLGLLGWRWTQSWRMRTGLATLAIIWIPLPYLLSHAETLWGPRLPLDGLLLCFTAFAIVYMIPGLRGRLAEGPEVIKMREI